MKTNALFPILLVISLLASVGTVFGQDDNPVSHSQVIPAIRAQVDLRVELFTIVARLAGLEEYATNTIPSYSEAIDRHFEPYREHAAIAFVRNLREKHSLGYDAVVTMAVHLSAPPALKPRVPWETAFTDGGLDDRWGSIAQAEEFIGLLRKFYKDARCEQFFESQQAFYSKVESRFQPVLDQVDLAWYPEFYGEMPGGTFYVYVLLDSRGNYGPEVVLSEREKDIYALITTREVDADGLPVYGERQLATLIHEFSHPYINPLFFGNKSAFEAAGERIFASAQKVREIGYGNWESPVIESLVRAAVIRYLLAHETEPQAAYDRLIFDRNLGFIWIEELVHLLGAYENSRDPYPSFRDFFPLIVGYFTDLAERIEREAGEYEQRLPRVIGLEPFSNGTSAVDPTLRELTLRFDRPLEGKSVQAGKEELMKNTPWITGLDIDPSGTVVRMQIGLKPGMEYMHTLKGSLFRTPDGYPLADYELTFKTE